MRKVVPVAVVLVLLTCLLGSALYAQDKPGLQVTIDKDRNAILSSSNSTSSAGQGKSSIHYGTDLASGLSTLDMSATMPPDEAAKAKGTGALYAEVNDTQSMAVANASFQLPADAKVKLSADGTAVQTGDDIGLNAKFDLSMPNPDPAKIPFSKLALDGTSKTDYQNWTAGLHVNLTMPDVQKKLQVNNMQLTLIDTTDKDNKVTTSVQFTASLDPSSKMAESIKQIGAQKSQMEDNIKAKLGLVGGLTVDTVKIDKADVSATSADFAFTLKVEGLRDALNRYSDLVPFEQNGFDPAQMKAAITNLTALTFDKLDVNVKFDKDTVTGSADLSAKNFAKTMNGYLALVETIQQAKGKQMLAQAASNPSSKMAVEWFLDLEHRTTQFSRDSFEAMSTNGVTLDQSFSLAVDAKPDQLAITGNLQQKMNNTAKAIAQLRTKGWPMPERSGVLLNVKTDSNNNATGTFYGTAKGNIIEALKSFLVTPAQQDPDLKPTADLLASVKVQDARASADYKDGSLTSRAYLQNSDLTAVAAAATKAIAPTMQGDLTGLRFTFDSDGAKGVTTGSAGFKQFMPGKSNEDVQNVIEQLTKEPNVNVKSDADAAATTLNPKLSRPTVEMPPELASVQKMAEAQLFPVSAVAGGGKAPGLGMIVGVAVAVLVLLGIALSAGKKK